VADDTQHKIGDKFIRLPRVKAHPLRRVLGIPGLYSAGYGNVGSSIYYALGVITLAAMGATPVVLAVAGIFFIFTALTYAEGTAMLPEAGGSASFARHGFNDFMGFTSGWALMLSYIVTIAISAFTIPPYLGLFWAPLKEDPFIGTTVSAAIILFLMTINVIGIKETSVINVMATVLDLLVQISIIVLGFFLVFNLDNFIHNVTFFWPTWDKLFLGIALAAIAYTGVETMSQMAEETKQPAKKVPTALILMVFTVLILFGGVATVGFSTMTPAEVASTWSTDPIAGIAHYISLAIAPREIAAQLASEEELVIILSWIFTGIRQLLPILIAILAASILLIATNAGLMGISRLAFSLGRYRLIPATLSRVHPRSKTPFVSIIIFSLIAVAILIPSLFAREGFLRLGSLYAFGSLLSFVLAHASLLSLRIKNPDWHRPFKLGLNIKVKKYELPLTAILGLVGTFIIWGILLLTQEYSRWVGIGWMVFGLIFYLIFRLINKLPLGGKAQKPGVFQVKDGFQTKEKVSDI
jgi:APA family basic amino acid/polyamine antiporter